MKVLVLGGGFLLLAFLFVVSLSGGAAISMNAQAPAMAEAVEQLAASIPQKVEVEEIQLVQPEVEPMEARDPGTIIIPPATSDKIPSPSGHILNHERGPYTAALKTATYYTIFNAFYGGQPPDWCGQRPTDQSIVIVYYGLEVTRIVMDETMAYRGLAYLFNQAAPDRSTTFHDVIQVNGRPDPQMNNGNLFDEFEPRDCPPPGALAP